MRHQCKAESDSEKEKEKETADQLYAQRLTALAEVIQFLAVKSGSVRTEYVRFALSLKDLAQQVARTIPRAPRYADAELLDKAETMFADFYREAALFVADHTVGDVAASVELASTCRSFFLAATQTPLFGSQRGQSVARMQVAGADVCNRCKRPQCRGNRIEINEEEGKTRVIVSHHKNELAGRTQVSIELEIRVVTTTGAHLFDS